MKRTLLVAMLLTISVAGVGCTMCQNCWDYQGPVVGCDGVPAEGFSDRAGSVLGSGGIVEGTPTEAAIPSEVVPTPTPATARSQQTLRRR